MLKKRPQKFATKLEMVEIWLSEIETKITKHRGPEIVRKFSVFFGFSAKYQTFQYPSKYLDALKKP